MPTSPVATGTIGESMRILLNGINTLSAGGRGVVSNVVTSMVKVAPDIHFDLVLPAAQGYDDWQSTGNLRVHLVPCGPSRVLGRLADLYWRVPRWCREFQSDLCFTLGDAGPIQLDIPHVVLLQQAMIAYRDPAFERFCPVAKSWQRFLSPRWRPRSHSTL